MAAQKHPCAGPCRGVEAKATGKERGETCEGAGADEQSVEGGAAEAEEDEEADGIEADLAEVVLEPPARQSPWGEPRHADQRESEHAPQEAFVERRCAGAAGTGSEGDGLRVELEDAHGVGWEIGADAVRGWGDGGVFQGVDGGGMPGGGCRCD